MKQAGGKWLCFFQSTDLCKNVQEQVLVSVALNKMFLGMTSSIFILIILQTEPSVRRVPYNRVIEAKETDCVPRTIKGGRALMLRPQSDA